MNHGIRTIAGPQLDALQAIAYMKGLTQTFNAIAREQERRANLVRIAA
jgi:hypothetical protein